MRINNKIVLFSSSVLLLTFSLNLNYSLQYEGNELNNYIINQENSHIEKITQNLIDKGIEENTSLELIKKHLIKNIDLTVFNQQLNNTLKVFEKNEVYSFISKKLLFNQDIDLSSYSFLIRMTQEKNIYISEKLKNNLRILSEQNRIC